MTLFLIITQESRLLKTISVARKQEKSCITVQSYQAEMTQVTSTHISLAITSSMGMSNFKKRWGMQLLHMTRKQRTGNM